MATEIAVRSSPSVPIDFSLSGVARYIQLATLFRRRIEAGQWAIGQQIPTVEELADECAVARATVRQALDILEADKLIERFRAKGTFCDPETGHSVAARAVPTDLSGLLLAAEGASIGLLKTEKGVMPAHVQHDIGTLAPSYTPRIGDGVTAREGQPYYIGDAYVDERLTRRIPKSGVQTAHDHANSA